MASSSLTQRNPTSSQPDGEQEQLETAPRPKRQHSLSERAMSHTLTTAADLANLLPTGTLLAFTLLIPVFTSNGSCDYPTHILTTVLLTLLSISCFLSSFSDSVKVDDNVYYGFATRKGMWVFNYPDPNGLGLPDLSKYRIRIVDWIHAVLSVLVFGAVALRDKNAVSCFYPAPEKGTKEVLDIVPIGVGVICGLLFLVFPATRHGIGYPVTGDEGRR
ncbi:Protein DMP [Arabidopsis suecica]|uniref:Protein DMP n=1 Tax=Arabidopsis suecica TaxID=45249 RepID=A0A8T1YJP7_ARASU|nr:Protein DMP [Arabidopsis suecica]